MDRVMFELLVALLVLIFVFSILAWAVSKAPIPAPWGGWAQFLLALVFALVILGWFFGGFAVPFHR